jgi:hypothetical protein
LTYDPLDRQIVMYGSHFVGRSDFQFYSDFWTWDGTQWTPVPTTGMPARSGASLAYDPVRKIFLLFGGVDKPGGQGLSDAWQWDRETWTFVEGCK